MTLAARKNELTITTPEGVAFSLQLAGPISRFLAWSIDIFTVSVIISLVNIAIAMLGLISPDIAFALIVLSSFLISIGYAIAFEWFWKGQTLGKRFLRLRVIDEHGLKLQFSQVMVRNLLRFVDSLPVLYLVGGLACFFSKNAQRLGDFAANTIVVISPRIREPDLDQILAGKYNSFNAYPHLEARLRQRVSPTEAQLALQALLRRDALDPKARIELFRQIATHFRNLLEFPQEATDGLSDEQYLRNVVESVYKPHN